MKRIILGLNREKMNKILMEVYKKDPLAKRMIDNVLKKQWIQDEIISNNELMRIFPKIIELTSFISNNELKTFSKEPKYRSIYNKVKRDFRKHSISPELLDEYKTRIKPTVKKIDYFIDCLQRKIYLHKYSEIKYLEKSDRRDREELIYKITKPIISNPGKQALLQKVAILRFMKQNISKFPYDVEDTKHKPIISKDKFGFQKYLAMQIYKPELLLPLLFTYEAKFKKFPLNWLMNLTIPELRFLYEEYKKGQLRLDYLKSEVSRENYLSTFFQETQELPFFKTRTRFIEQIIENHRNGRYAAAINLILPQIEALIWIIAAYLQKVRKVKIFRKAPITNYWEFNLQRYSKIELIQTNGKIIKGKQHITIKKLVSETNLNTFLHEAQVKFFVNELFEERNPILHGNATDYDSEIDSCKKIICLRYLIQQFVDKVTDIDVKKK